MKNYLIVSAVALALGGCSSLPTLNLQTQVELNTMEGIVSAYGVALNAENTYKSLPLCKTNTVPSLTNVCAKRSIIVNLQAADLKVNSAINQANNFIKANPTVDPSQYISSAQTALAALQSVLGTANATSN